MTRLVAAVRCLGAAFGAALVLSGCGSARQYPAPPAHALPLAAGVTIVRSNVSGNDVDSALHRQYRELLLAGLRHQHPVDTLRAEVGVLQRAGWRRVSTTWTNNAGDSVTTGLAHQGAITILDGPGKIYVALEYIASVHARSRETAVNDHGGSGPLRRLAGSRRPLLRATLGHNYD